MAHRLNGNYALRGTTFTVEVAPCCWTYPRYGFQIHYESAEGHSIGSLFIKKVLEKDATEETVDQLLAILIPGKCRTCHHACLFNPQYIDKPHDRKGECEKCFGKRVEQELAVELEKEQRLQARRDKRSYLRGYRWKAVCWVHPPRGDDYQLTLYYGNKPTDEQVVNELQEVRSRVLNDYYIVEVPVPDVQRQVSKVH